ncbi:MAG: hypothetical protein IIA59_07485 [Candidatus Marinimicrobia bacterium]|nr:hypothetical protein [Candidatus Neomarinimicrobiota bacterium]
MTSRRILAGLVLIVAPLAGQLPDSSETVLLSTALDQFPLWVPPGEAGRYPTPDSLALTWPQRGRGDGQLLRKPQWLGLGAVAVFAALSYTYHRQASAAYLAYQNSGDPSDLDALFRETQRLDRLTGWFYAGAEMGLVLVGISLALSP